MSSCNDWALGSFGGDGIVWHVWQLIDPHFANHKRNPFHSQSSRRDRNVSCKILFDRRTRKMSKKKKRKKITRAPKSILRSGGCVYSKYNYTHSAKSVQKPAMGTGERARARSNENREEEKQPPFGK